MKLFSYRPAQPSDRRSLKAALPPRTQIAPEPQCDLPGVGHMNRDQVQGRAACERCYAPLLPWITRVKNGGVGQIVLGLWGGEQDVFL